MSTSAHLAVAEGSQAGAGDPTWSRDKAGLVSHIDQVTREWSSSERTSLLFELASTFTSSSSSSSSFPPPPPPPPPPSSPPRIRPDLDTPWPSEYETWQALARLCTAQLKACREQREALTKDRLERWIESVLENNERENRRVKEECAEELRKLRDEMSKIKGIALEHQRLSISRKRKLDQWQDDLRDKDMALDKIMEAIRLARQDRSFTSTGSNQRGNDGSDREEQGQDEQDDEEGDEEGDEDEDEDEVRDEDEDMEGVDDEDEDEDDEGDNA